MKTSVSFHLVVTAMRLHARPVNCALCFLALVATGLARGKESEKTTAPAGGKERERATVALVEDQALVGDLVDPSITVATKYGTLTIPIAEVMRIRMRPAISDDEAARLRHVLDLVGSAADDSTLNDENLDAIRAYGARGYTLIEEAIARADDSRKDDLQAVIADIKKDDSVLLGPNDEIVTERFTVRGKIQESEFQVRCLGRLLAIPRGDIVSVTYEEPEIRKIFKVQPMHMERQGWLVTGIELRKNQRFKLEPSGTMTYDGQSFGPEGLSNHRWNSRNVGQLQYRIGESGAWKPLIADFDGKAEASGALHLSAHLFNATGTGEFKVIFRTQND